MNIRRRTRRPAPRSRSRSGLDAPPAKQITAGLQRATGPQAAYPLPPAPSGATRIALGELVAPDPFRVPAYAPAIAPPPPATAPQPAIRDGIAYAGKGPGPVRITGELPLYAEALQARVNETQPGHDALPTPIWCAGCGTDFTDEETGKFDREFQYLHWRAGEAGWRRVRPGDYYCPGCLNGPPVSMLNFTPRPAPPLVPHLNLPAVRGGLAAEVDLMIDVNARSPELHPGYDLYMSKPGRHGRRDGAST